MKCGEFGHLGPTTISSPSHFGPIFIVTSAPSYYSIILMKIKKERKKERKKEPALLLHIYIASKKERNTNKMTCAPSEDSDQLGHPPSLIRVFAVRMKKSWVLTYQLSAQSKTLIRLGRCPESSLGAKIILLV